jgi:hypothetical protein
MRQGSGDVDCHVLGEIAMVTWTTTCQVTWQW